MRYENLKKKEEWWSKRDSSWKKDYYASNLPFIQRLEEFGEKLKNLPDSNDNDDIDCVDQYSFVNYCGVLEL
jgi:hypothetical protein